MSVTYGFFNSLDGDRTYSADQISEYFQGLVSNGVYEDVGGALQVLASSGMTVNVAAGRAIINCKWLNNSAAQAVTITAANSALNRWTAVVVRLDSANRLMEIATKDGTAATTPTKPSISSNELCLAMIYVAAGATAITQADITDMRASASCGWVTGLIEQVDTSTLFLQWQTAYENYYAAQTAAFESWFAALTEQLQVNTFIVQFVKSATLTTGTTVALDMTGYEYDADDIIHVYINGLLGVSGTDYSLSVSGTSATVTGLPAGDIFVEVLRSQIGWNT